MENIINNDNLLDQNLALNILKECPYCNIILPIKEFEDHILCHEIDQNENRDLSHNINGYGLNNAQNNISESEKESPNIIKNLFEKVDTFIKKNFKNENNERNQSNNINSNIQNNINNNSIHRHRMNSNISRFRNNRVKKRIFSEVSNFFKNIMNSGNEEDNNEPIFNLRLPRNRRSSVGEINHNRNNNRNRNNHRNINRNNHINNNINIINDEEDDIRDILLSRDNSPNRDDYNEIIKYIPSSTINAKKPSTDSNYKCIICLSDFKIGEKESTLPCLHIFHTNCIENWLKRRRNCPICKFNISLNSLLPEDNY